MTKWFWHKYRQTDQWNGPEKQMMLEISNSCMKKKMKFDSYFALFTEITSNSS